MRICRLATVGGLDHAASKALGRRRHGFGLLGQQQAAALIRQMPPSRAPTMRTTPGRPRDEG
jgi:hypothetical protein